MIKRHHFQNEKNMGNTEWCHSQIFGSYVLESIYVRYRNIMGNQKDLFNLLNLVN